MSLAHSEDSIMTDIRRFIIPGFVFAAMAVIFMTRLLYSPTQVVLANSSEETPVEPADSEAEPAAAVVEESRGCGLPSSYPDTIQQWCQPIMQSSAYYGLDPKLIAAVMLQESGGNPDAYSKSGAVGLMQVMPRDGLASEFMCANGPCFSARPSMDELFDPQFNIDFGIMMLSGLISKFGDIREGLRAYGPMDSGYHYADLVLTIYNNYQ
ncbi:lytic transglycosylase domain-containing protein [bacterium]|nr:lytic transglycosylase domain-containing protein [bacterium]